MMYICLPNSEMSTAHPTSVDRSSEKTPKEWLDQQVYTVENVQRSLDEGVACSYLELRLLQGVSELCKISYSKEELVC